MSPRSGFGARPVLCRMSNWTRSIQDRKLPDTSEFGKNEIIIQSGHRNTYDRCLRISRSKLQGSWDTISHLSVAAARRNFRKNCGGLFFHFGHSQTGRSGGWKMLLDSKGIINPRNP